MSLFLATKGEVVCSGRTSSPFSSAILSSCHLSLFSEKLISSPFCTSETEGSRLSTLRSLTRVRSARPADVLEVINRLSQVFWHYLGDDVRPARNKSGRPYSFWEERPVNILLGQYDFCVISHVLHNFIAAGRNK